MNKLVLGVLGGAAVIAAFTIWSERQRERRDAALHDRRQQQIRVADSLKAAAAATRRTSDSIGAILTRDIPRIREVIRRDTIPWVEQPGTVLIHTSTLVQADSTLARTQDLLRASSLALETSENRAESLGRLAQTNYALYLNQKRRARFSKGIQFGAGACGTPNSPTPTFCGYVGYGFQIKVP